MAEDTETTGTPISELDPPLPKEFEGFPAAEEVAAARGRVFSSVADVFSTWTQVSWTEFLSLIWKALKAWWEKDVENFAQNVLNSTADILQEQFEVPGRITRHVRNAGILRFPLDIVVAGVLATLVPIKLLFTWVGAVANLWAQEANEQVRPNLVELNVLAANWWRFPDERDKVLDLFQKWGLPHEQIGMYLSSTVGLPSLTEMMVLVNRKEMELETAQTLLQAQGIPESYASSMLELRKFYPSPTDLVSLAGREAFEPASIERFRLDLDFDLIDKSIFERAGVTEEVAKWYWIAHWNNPSLQQVFEMVHRKVLKPDAQGNPERGGVFGLDDLSVYYKLADINPFFGDMLRQIAYNVPGRVDIRRFLRDDVIKEGKALELYESLGYNKEHAGWMVDFALKEKNRGTRNITRSQIEQLYRLGEIDRPELEGWLEAIGYADDNAKAISWLEFAKREEKRLQTFIRRAEYEYKRYIMDKVDVQKFLSDENVTAEYIDELVDEWNNERVFEQAVPSKDDWIDWLSAGRIGPVEFRDGMERLRYQTADIDKYLEFQGAVLSKTDFLRLFDRSEIEEERARIGLTQLGYQVEDVEALIREVNGRKERRLQFEQAQGSGSRSRES